MCNLPYLQSTKVYKSNWRVSLLPILPTTTLYNQVVLYQSPKGSIMQIDLGKLKKRCRSQSPQGVEIARGLWYTDNDASILGIAHLDFVPQTTHFDFVRIMPGNHKVVYSGQLDNRLGVYTVSDVLKTCGVKCDVLLTTDEEKCKSTARQFVTDKAYNWAFSFDRAGSSDVALYQYIDEQTSSAVRQVGLRPAHGSYSDIVELEHLGCKCFNWCNGLQSGHSATAHVKERDYIACVLRFLDFWDIYSGVHFPHKQSELWPIDEFDLCEWCGEFSKQLQSMGDCWVCADCASTDKWLDECTLCGTVAVVEWQAAYDAWLCEPCAQMVIGG